MPVRIHGQHGRAVEDLDGADRRLRRLRSLYSSLVLRYITVSQALQRYLVQRVGIRPALALETPGDWLETER